MSGRDHLRFDEKYVEPLLDGEKTTAVRHDLGEVKVGGYLTAETHDGERFATLYVEAVATAHVSDAIQAIEILRGSHGAESTDELIESLNEHYDGAVTEDSIVKIVKFEVL